MNQQEYIEILANDLGYDRSKMYKNISDIINRKTKFHDEMTTAEKSIVIEEFKSRKVFKRAGFNKDILKY